MAFMQQEIVKGDWIEVDGNWGTTVFPAEYFSIKQARNEYKGKDIYDVTVRKGWYGARLSAPGFMDCTDWSVFKTAEAAREYLNEQYGEDDDLGD